jgi:8-oxo-dGTP diphosphatase
MPVPGPTTIDVAAGGLLESGDGADPKIAVVHRPRYDDWTLPKGHLDPGETLEQAALREVLEETGCTGQIIEIVQPTSYLVNGQPKIVVYFRMMLLKHGDLRPNSEVSDIAWLTPREARSQLSYETEQQLVKGVYGLS